MRSRRASSPRGPTSCTPSGSPFAPVISGRLTAGIPHSVQSVQNAGSPVESIVGAVPGAAGVNTASQRANNSSNPWLRAGMRASAFW